MLVCLHVRLCVQVHLRPNQCPPLCVLVHLHVHVHVWVCVYGGV